jgi:flagellar hook-basal body complex protein FliE
MNIPSDFINVGKGHLITLKTNDVRHFPEKPERITDDDVATSFKDMLSEAVGKVNDLQVQANDLNQQMIYEPESVDIHTVMIAAQKAEVALSFTKAIRDEAVRAYREIINMR